MNSKLLPFAIAALLPTPLLVGGAMLGGIWIWAALAYLTVLTFALDSIGGQPKPDASPDQPTSGANALSGCLGVVHFGLLALGVWAISGQGNLTVVERIVAFFAFGLFLGQVSNSNAHELIHRQSKHLFQLGKFVYISLLFGHHTSAHRLVHHRFVATTQDPNSARLGQTAYRFLPRAWIGSFRAGLDAENRRRLGAKNNGIHPYVTYIFGALVGFAVAAWIGGLAGCLSYIAISSHATAQLLLSDYVQHYGLRREADENGEIPPVGPEHSWNSPRWFSGLMMLRAAYHSDHHAHPGREYPELTLRSDMPMLPYSLPIMGAIALFPRTWRRIMDPRVAALAQSANSGPNPL